MSCWYLSLEEVLRNGQEELDLFEEFLDLWIEYLDSQQGRHTDQLIQEAQSLMNNEEKELENARKYADRYPALYEQYLKNSYKTGEDERHEYRETFRMVVYFYEERAEIILALLISGK